MLSSWKIKSYCALVAPIQVIHWCLRIKMSISTISEYYHPLVLESQNVNMNYQSVLSSWNLRYSLYDHLVIIRLISVLNWTGTELVNWTELSKICIKEDGVIHIFNIRYYYWLSKANLKIATLVLSEVFLLGGIGFLLDECPKLKHYK